MVKQNRSARVEERELAGLMAKTFLDRDGNIEAVIASGGGSTIVAIPLAVIGRDNQMGTDELECLNKCRRIEDLEKRLNCIAACPVTKKYRVFIA